MCFLLYDRCSVSVDLSEDGLSSEEDGNSSDSSKEDTSHLKDKEVLQLYTDTQNHITAICLVIYGMPLKECSRFRTSYAPVTTSMIVSSVTTGNNFNSSLRVNTNKKLCLH